MALRKFINPLGKHFAHLRVECWGIFHNHRLGFNFAHGKFRPVEHVHVAWCTTPTWIVYFIARCRISHTESRARRQTSHNIHMLRRILPLIQLIIGHFVEVLQAILVIGAKNAPPRRYPFWWFAKCLGGAKHTSANERDYVSMGVGLDGHGSVKSRIVLRDLRLKTKSLKYDYGRGV